MRGGGRASVRIPLRSPDTCDRTKRASARCAICYAGPARGTLVNIGEAVGIIAAQSMVNPVRKQATMRTFHIGGIARGGQQSFIARGAGRQGGVRNAKRWKTPMASRRRWPQHVDAIIERGGARTQPPRSCLRQRSYRQGRRNGRATRKMFGMGLTTPPIIAEKAGIARYVDTFRPFGPDRTDDATGALKIVTTGAQRRKATAGAGSSSSVGTGEAGAQQAGQPCHLSMSVILSVEDGPGDPGPVTLLLLLFVADRARCKTKDIAGGRAPRGGSINFGATVARGSRDHRRA